MGCNLGNFCCYAIFGCNWSFEILYLLVFSSVLWEWRLGIMLLWGYFEMYCMVGLILYAKVLMLELYLYGFVKRLKW